MSDEVHHTPNPTEIAALEEQLKSYDLVVRTEAFEQLLSLTGGDLSQKPLRTELANMHCHSFFSHSPFDYSPSSLVWLARQHRIGLMGIVDFHTLDGADEFLTASEQAGIRGSVGVEMRIFIPEFADYVINAVGEPGVYYHMGVGFTTKHIPPGAASVFEEMRQLVAEHNRSIVARLNDYLTPIHVDYGADVLPLTPSGNAIERHIILAFVQKVDLHMDDPVDFWADRIGLPRDQVEELVQSPGKFRNVVRAKLIRRGGMVYSPPDPSSFPSVEQFHEFIVGSGAIPCATWLDGTSPGEQMTEALLDLLIGKGVAALNIIPDRNWNVADPKLREIKVQNLYDVVALADRLDLPLIVGTELNSPGQKLVDDFDAPELVPLRHSFIDGAYFIYGHTEAQRTMGLGYQSAWAHQYFPTRHDRNRFYTELGRQLKPGAKVGHQVGPRAAELAPSQLLDMMRAV
jgi:hypothetical protein